MWRVVQMEATKEAVRGVAPPGQREVRQQHAKRPPFWRKAGRIVWRILRAGLIIGICYVILMPLMTKISSSFMEVRDMFDVTVRWIPRHFTLENYKVVWEAMKYPTAFWNSLKLSLIVAVLQTFSSALVGYGFARFKFKGSNLLFALVLVTLLVPSQTILVPLYLNFRYFNLFGLIPGQGLNLLNSYWPFILIAMTGAGMRGGLFIYVMRQYFRNVPKELEDAAYVDGASPLRTFFTVMLPGAVPSMVTIFLLSFVFQWNDSTLTSVFMGNEVLLPWTLRTLADTLGARAEYASLVNNTGMLLFMAPLLILYFVMQKHFVEGVERTGIVG
mgnify:CR=1 FL=1